MRLAERFPTTGLLLAATLLAGCDSPGEPAVATQLGLKTAPAAAAVNGAVLAQTPVVQLRDAGGKAVSQGGVSVTVSVNSGGGTLGGTTTVVTAGNGRASFTDLAIIGVIGDRTLSFGSGALTPVVSGTIALTAGPANRLGFATPPPANSPSDASFATPPVVQVQDVSGNAVAQVGLSVVASLASGGGVLVGTKTQLTNGAGAAAFADLQLAGLVGPRTIAFTSGTLTPITSGPIDLTPGAAFQLVLVTAPSTTAQSTVALAVQPSVRVQDIQGNVVPGAGRVVTASVTSGSPAITNATASTDAGGTATFAGLTLTGSIADYTLRFSSPSLPILTATAPTALAAGPATRVTITTQPSSIALSGVPLTSQPVIQVRDAAGNAVLGVGTSVSAEIVGGGATLAGATVLTNAGGTAVFTQLALSGTAGTYTLRFTSGGLTAATSPVSTTLDATCTLATLGDADGDRLPDCIESGSLVYISPQDPGTLSNDPDTDDDGIPDGDEVLGSAGGFNLPALGVNPLKRDLLMEFDWFDDALECGAHSHRPTIVAVNKVIAAFAAAPVNNPNGTTGVNFIADYGQGGVFTGGNLAADPDGVLGTGVSGAEFNAHKNANHAAERRPYFHYSLHPHRYNANSTSSGQAELPGNDQIVSLYCAGSDQNVANTIVHELGHNLFLQHGGFEGTNYKPNYNSVMNYRYQFPGADNDCTPPGNGVLGYSTGVRISLNESSLDEQAGICGLGVGPPIDWNGDGDATDVGLVWDINRDGANIGDGFFSIVADYNDWANIFFLGLNAGDGASAMAPEIVSCPAVPPRYLRRR